MSFPSAVPGWIQIFGALGTPILAALVALVAWGQWRVAKRKLILDLFEKRYALFQQLEDLIVDIIADRADHDQYEHRSVRLRAQIHFLFGHEVNYYLSNLDVAIARRFIALRDIDALYPGTPERIELAKIIQDGNDALGNFASEFYLVCRPFMLMDQRNPVDLRLKAWIKFTKYIIVLRHYAGKMRTAAAFSRSMKSSSRNDVR